MTTPKIGMKIPLLMLLAVFALSACTSTDFQRQNRAGIERASHDLTAASLDEQSVRLGLEAALTQLYGNYANAYGEAIALKTSVLPGAEEAFRFARGGYDAGKFNYLEVLDAQRTLFEARKQLNEVSLDYHRQRATLERIAAVHEDKNKEQKNEQFKN